MVISRFRKNTLDKLWRECGQWKSLIVDKLIKINRIRKRIKILIDLVNDRFVKLRISKIKRIIIRRTLKTIIILKKRRIKVKINANLNAI